MKLIGLVAVFIIVIGLVIYFWVPGVQGRVNSWRDKTDTEMLKACSPSELRRKAYEEYEKNIDSLTDPYKVGYQGKYRVEKSVDELETMQLQRGKNEADATLIADWLDSHEVGDVYTDPVTGDVYNYAQVRKYGEELYMNTERLKKSMTQKETSLNRERKEVQNLFANTDRARDQYEKAYQDILSFIERKKYEDALDSIQSMSELYPAETMKMSRDFRLLYEMASDQNFDRPANDRARNGGTPGYMNFGQKKADDVIGKLRSLSDTNVSEKSFSPTPTGKINFGSK